MRPFKDIKISVAFLSPIQDDYIEKYLKEIPLNLKATLDARAGYADADFVVIAAPTNYDPQMQCCRKRMAAHSSAAVLSTI